MVMVRVMSMRVIVVMVVVVVALVSLGYYQVKDSSAAADELHHILV